MKSSSAVEVPHMYVIQRYFLDILTMVGDSTEMNRALYLHFKFFSSKC